MGLYIIRRLIEGLVTLWLITLAVFFILRLGGGNPIAYMLPPEATQADIDKLTKAYGGCPRKPQLSNRELLMVTRKMIITSPCYLSLLSNRHTEIEDERRRWENVSALESGALPA